MDTNEALNITNTLAEYTRCFTIEDLLAFAEEEQDKETLIQTIENDFRFLQTCEQTSSRKYFAAKKALYHWYVNLNIRLAKAHTAKLSNRQLVSLMSSLSPNGIWTSLPTEYIMFGQQFYLISPTMNPSEYVFPVAHILSFMSHSNIKAAADFLYGFPYDQESPLPAEQIITQSIQAALARLSDAKRYVIVRRQGLFGVDQMTLEQIGQGLCVTRERVRQIEEGCWKRVWHPKFSRALVAPLLSYVLHNHGSLVVSSNRLKPEIGFIAKCLNIPLVQFPNTDLLVLGETHKRSGMLEKIWDNLLDIEAIANYLQSIPELTLIRSDMIRIAEALALALPRHLTKSQKVYLALKQIGRPAHFAKISQTYYSLFPKDYISDHAVHAILTREEHGVVWIGIKGTYALKEWGYERPSSTLFETIAEIVEKKYAETSKPVSSLVIQAEVGKYRKVVNPNSIIFATYLNLNLLRVNEDHFIPKPANESQVETPAEELDRILEEFEKRRKE
jgi:hypothetical protein